MFKFLISVTVVIALTGCCSFQNVPEKERLLKKYSEFSGKTIDLYEVSLDFWQKMEQIGNENILKLFDGISTRGLGVKEQEEKISKRVALLHKRHSNIDQIITQIRQRMDPQKDVLFYYNYYDEHNPSKSSEGILVVRNGRIRDKIVF